MKMLVPLDMNGKKIMNTNFDLKFGDIFKIFECTVRPNRNRMAFLVKKNDNQTLSFSFPIGLLTFVFKDNFHQKERNKISLYFYTPDKTIVESLGLENVGFNVNPRYRFSEDLVIYRQLHYVKLHHIDSITRTYDINLVITYM